MKNINTGIVFSNDINQILNGINAFDYKYIYKPEKNQIKEVRNNFKKEVNKIFKGQVTIIEEEKMLEINNLIGGEYPHCLLG